MGAGAQIVMGFMGTCWTKCCARSQDHSVEEETGEQKKCCYTSCMEIFNCYGSLMVLTLSPETPFRQKWFEVLVSVSLSLAPMAAEIALRSYTKEQLLQKAPRKRCTYFLQNFLLASWNLFFS